ncbi:MAG: cupredoxin domain-containing protein, partial [Chthoniobacterales bacterium]
SVGPAQPEDSELIDITGKKMKLVYETFTDPEPHFAQILKADKIKPIEVYPKDENKDPNAVWDAAQTGQTRNGNEVIVKVTAIRSRFVPDRIDAKVGDTLTIHVTNIEQSADMIHGFGLVENNLNITIDPGETKTLQLKLTKPGVFPFYCTNFCSALHQEMQGYLVVKNEGAAEAPSEEGNSATLPPRPKTDAVDGEPAVPADSLPAVPGNTPPRLPNASPAPTP